MQEEQSNTFFVENEEVKKIISQMIKSDDLEEFENMHNKICEIVINQEKKKRKFHLIK